MKHYNEIFADTNSCFKICLKIATKKLKLILILDTEIQDLVMRFIFQTLA